MFDDNHHKKFNFDRVTLKKIILGVSLGLMSSVNLNAAETAGPPAPTGQDPLWGIDLSVGGSLLKPGISIVTIGTLVNPGAGDGDHALKLFDTVTGVTPTDLRPLENPNVHTHHNWDVGSIGNVFGIAVDKRRNIYAAASTHWGAGYYQGGAARIGFGEIGDSGVSGETSITDNDQIILDSNSGAGTIYKLDAITGNATVFAQLPQTDVAFNQGVCEGGAADIPRNTGPALGNIAYDPIHNQFFVSNFSDGKIYRLDENGVQLGVAFDSPIVGNGIATVDKASPYGVAVNPDGTKLYFGTNEINTQPRLFAVDLDNSGNFILGSEEDQDAQLNVDLTYTQNIGAGITTDPWVAYSDLKFSPNGELMIGIRTGCENNFATSHNHGGAYYLLVADGAGKYNQAAPQVPGNTNAADAIGDYDEGAFPIHYRADPYGKDDGYGGVAIFDKGTGAYDYLVTSADIEDEPGPHGFLLFPHDFTATGSDTNPGTFLIRPGAAFSALPSSTSASNDYKGVGGDIEVLSVLMDWGDAPDTYSTDLYVGNATGGGDVRGPSHIITSDEIFLGTTVDDEFNGSPNISASGDDATDTPDDEDGISAFPDLLAGASSYTIPAANITAGNSSGGPVTIHAWIDFDGNGTFDADEYTTTTVNDSATSPTSDLEWSGAGVSGVTGGTTYARFRITNDPAINPGTPAGYAINGEVEDYPINVTSLGSIIWNDANADGIQDAGEQGIAGAEIVLLGGTTGNPIPNLHSQTTSADGLYHFANLPEGNYKVQVTMPLGYVKTINQVTGDNIDTLAAHANDSNITTTLGSVHTSGTFNLDLDTEPSFDSNIVNSDDGDNTEETRGNMTVDFGFYQPVAIGNVLFFDDGTGVGIRDNGIQDGTEPNVGVGVVVQLFTSTGTLVSSTATDANGRYYFDNLAPGSYYVKVPASEFAATKTLENYSSSTGADATETSDSAENGIDAIAATFGIQSNTFVLASGTEAAGEDQTDYPGTLPDNSVNATADFGFVKKVAIGNVLFFDNGAGVLGVFNNGIQDGSEPNVGAGVKVDLHTAANAFVSTTTTDGNGRYYFDNLAEGSYYVKVPASEFAATKTLEEYLSSTGADGTETSDTAENGIDDTAPATNGIQSNTFVLTSGSETTSDDETDYPGTLPDNSINATADFGFAKKVAIGNQLFLDTGAGGGNFNNGVQDGTEPNVGSGVIVQLYDSSNTLVKTTATDSNGRYYFDEIPEGNYYVKVPASEFGSGKPLENYLSSQGADATETDDSKENGIDNTDPAANGIQTNTFTLEVGGETTSDNQTAYPGTLADNSVNATADLGFVKKVAIGNIIFLDTGVGVGGIANNGIQDGTEPTVAGVKVELYTSANAFVGNTTTGGTGHYYFDNLPEGSYYVKVPASEFAATKALEGYLSSTGADATDTDDSKENGIDDSDPATDDGIRSNTVVLTAGGETTTDDQTAYLGTLADNSVNATVDFGFVKKVAIGNLLFLDTGIGAGGIANNGIQDGTEPGLPAGVAVELYTSANVLVKSTTTDGNGRYYFDDIAEGSYYVKVPASEFAATQPLEDYLSSTGADVTETDDAKENGIDNSAPATNGIITNTFVLVAGGETTSDDQTAYSGTLPDNSVNATADLGFVKKVAIGNLLFLDTGVGVGGTANNGIQDGTEPGLPAGVVVELYTSADVLVKSTTTDGNGRYYFDDIAEGDYYVKVPASEFGSGKPLEGYLSSTGADATKTDDTQENGIDEAAPATNGIKTNTFTLVTGGETTSDDQTAYSGTLPDNSVNATADLGFVKKVAIGNVLFIDNGVGGGTVNNGIQDGTELGVPAGVVVELYTPADVLVKSTVTDGNGRYYFDDIAEGDYYVKVPASEFGSGKPLESHISSNDADNTESDDNLENGIDDNALATNGIKTNTFSLVANGEVTGESQTDYPGTLPDNSVNATADLGFTPSVKIGDLVWIEGDNDGDASNGGNTFPPAGTVVIATASDGFTTYTGVTDGSGNFEINVPENDSYVVRVSTPEGTVPTSGSGDSSVPPNASENNATHNNAGTLVTVTNEDNLTLDFGFTPAAAPGSLVKIGDTIWIEVDGDGDISTDPGNNTFPPIGTLVIATASDGITTYTAVTDAVGHYEIEVPQGDTYIVKVETPIGTLPSAGSTDNSVPDTTSENGLNHDGTGTEVIVGTEDNLTLDFGFTPNPDPTVIIGDTVWIESDYDGDFNTAVTSIPEFATVTATSTTTGETYVGLVDGNGHYEIEVPENDDYIVTVDTPFETIPTNGSDDDTAGEDDMSHDGNGTSVSVTTEDDLTVDFGFIGYDSLGTITGNVGEQVLNEVNLVGIPDVTLTLLDSNGDVYATTTTDPFGDYEFTLVPPGTYSIVETQPAGFANVSDVEGDPNDNLIESIIMPDGGAEIIGQDFIEVTSIPTDVPTLSEWALLMLMMLLGFVGYRQAALRGGVRF